MADDWKVGDLALCVDASPPRVIDGLIECEREYVTALRIGGVYNVTHIVTGRTVPVIGLGDIGRRAGGVSDRFIKITPEEADDFDLETIELMNRKTVGETV